MVVRIDSMERLPLEPRDIGGELLDILSRGLYSNAKDAIREYAQNGIDADASNIWVSVDGPRVTVHDDGHGMDWETLRRARRFGMSDKNTQENVGFRGIGIYSAFGMCDSLEIATHQLGASDEYAVHFNFGEMRRILEDDRSGELRSGVALSDLLYEYVRFNNTPYQSEYGDRQYTVVTLDGIEQEYRAQLSDASDLNDYLLNTLPAAFPDEGYGPTVSGWLSEHVKIRPVQIFLRVGDEPEISVHPQLVAFVDPPERDWIRGSDGTSVAFAWHALSPYRRRLGSRFAGDDSADAAGFLLRLKGFTLGDRMALKVLWPALGGGALYHHFTGEVHILEGADVFPNAARDGLEPSVAQQDLEKRIRDYFDGLNRRADLNREINHAGNQMDVLRETLAGLTSRFESEDEDPFELYRLCRNHLEELSNTERQMLRLTRGRKAIRPTPDQKESLDNIRALIADSNRKTNNLLRRAQRFTESRRRASNSDLQPPPQVAMLNRAVAALTSMGNDSPSADVQQAISTVQAAARAQSVSRTVAVLDGLKAQGLRLTDEVESARQELRSSLGWSATGPVSLEELIADLGFSIETHEQWLLFVRALDQGLVLAASGRGQQYETALRAVAEELSQDIT